MPQEVEATARRWPVILLLLLLLEKYLLPGLYIQLDICSLHPTRYMSLLKLGT
jgi:hypothetical protein